MIAGSRPHKGPVPASAPPGTGAFFMPGRRQQGPPAILLAHGFRLRDGYWNQMRSDGADPREVDTLASTKKDATRVEQSSIVTSPGSRM